MNDLTIQQLTSPEEIPWELLLLADPSKEQINQYILSGRTYLARIKDIIAGVYVLTDEGDHVFEIKNVAVLESFQGKGLGKKLVLHAIATTKSLGAKKITVGTGNSSLNQLALYQKCGFRIVGVEKDFFTKHYAEEIIENGIVCKDMIRLEINF